MPSTALVRIYRPRAIFGWGGYFNVIIDGVERGQLWSKQLSVFEVSPGRHRLQLKYGLISRSSRVEFEANAGEVIDFACSAWQTALGWTGLRSATAKDRTKMESIAAHPPPPRNISPQDS